MPSSLKRFVAIAVPEERNHRTSRGLKHSPTFDARQTSRTFCGSPPCCRLRVNFAKFGHFLLSLHECIVRLDSVAKVGKGVAKQLTDGFHSLGMTRDKDSR